MKKEYQRYLNYNKQFDKITLLEIISLLIVIAGNFGFLYEFIFYYFNGGMKNFYWRGGNFLPWINIYATGSILIYFLTYKYRNNALKVFLISLILCSIILIDEFYNLLFARILKLPRAYDVYSKIGIKYVKFK